MAKTLFFAFTKDQAQILMNVVNRLETDVIAGKSIEQIETDVLNEAVAEELAEIIKIKSEAVQAFLALTKAQIATTPAAPATPAA